MDNNRLQAHSISELWKLTTNLLLDKGDKKLNHELLNLIMVLDDFREDVDFDLSFLIKNSLIGKPLVTLLLFLGCEVNSFLTL